MQHVVTSVVANGVSHHVETFGQPSRPSLLLITGLGGQCIEWRPGFCQLLAQYFYVIRYDLRDGGLSEKCRHLDSSTPDVAAVVAGEAIAPYSLFDLADDAAGIIDGLGIAPAGVMGYSLGGMIAQRLAIDYPERVQWLASLSSTTGSAVVGQANAEMRQRLLSKGSQYRSQADRIVGIVESRKAQEAGRYASPEDSELRDHAWALVSRGVYDEGRNRQLLAAITGEDRTKQLGALTQPALVVHGNEDPLIDVSGGRATAEAIPNVDYWEIEGMGHQIPHQIWEPLLERLKATAQASA